MGRCVPGVTFAATHPSALLARLAPGTRLALKHREERAWQEGGHGRGGGSAARGGALTQQRTCAPSWPRLPGWPWGPCGVGEWGGGERETPSVPSLRGGHGWTVHRGKCWQTTPPRHPPPLAETSPTRVTPLGTHPVSLRPGGAGGSGCPRSTLHKDKVGAISLGTGDRGSWGGGVQPTLCPQHLHQVLGGRGARWDPGGRGDLQGEGAQLSSGRMLHTGAPTKCWGCGVGWGGHTWDTHPSAPQVRGVRRDL